MIFWTGMNHEHTPTRVKGPSFHPYKAHLLNFLGMCYTISTETMYGLRGLHQFWIMTATSWSAEKLQNNMPRLAAKHLMSNLGVGICSSDFFWIFSRNTENKSRWAWLSICKDSSPSIQQPNKLRIDRIARYASPEGPTSLHWFEFCWMFFSEMEDGGGRHTKTQRFGVFICRLQTAEIEKILWKIFVGLGSSKVLQIKKWFRYP